MMLHMIIAGTVLCAAWACALPGMFLVLRGVALLSDAISHSILLGIVCMFLLIHNLESPLLFWGASCMGLITVWSVEYLISTRRVKNDAAIGLLFPFFFSVAVILISKYVRNVHLDVDMVLLGEVALTPFKRWIIRGYDMGPLALWHLLFLLIGQISILCLFFKQLVAAIFDNDMMHVMGKRPLLTYYCLMFVTSMTAVSVFDIVGSIVVVALMITPAATAFLWARSMVEYFVMTLLIATVSALGGYAAAAWYNVSIAGAVAVCAGVLFAWSFLVGRRYGLWRGWFYAYRERQRIKGLLLLRYMQENPTTPIKTITRIFGWSILDILILLFTQQSIRTTIMIEKRYPFLIKLR